MKAVGSMVKVPPQLIIIEVSPVQPLKALALIVRSPVVVMEMDGRELQPSNAEAPIEPTMRRLFRYISAEQPKNALAGTLDL